MSDSTDCKCPVEEEEERLAKVHRQKVEEQWKATLKEEKLESLRNELALLKIYHEEEIRQQDASLERLQQGFDQAEDQQGSSFATHVGRIQELTRLFEEGLLLLEQDFKEKLEFVQHEYESEREAMAAQHNEKKRLLLDEMEALKAHEEQRRIIDERRRHQEIEEIKGKQMEEINNLRFILDSRDLEEQCEAAHMEYLQHNDHKEVDYETLVAKDTKMRREIEELVRRVDKLQGAVERVQGSSRRNDQQRTEKSELLMDKKQAALGRSKAVQGEMNRQNDLQYKRIAALTASAKTCKENLQEKKGTAQRILQLAEIIKTYESSMYGAESETCTDSSSSKEQSNVLVCYHGCDDDKEAGLIENAKRRHARAEDNLKAQGHRLEQIRRENKALRAKLKCYQDGTTLNDDVVRKDNPLIVINGRMS